MGQNHQSNRWVYGKKIVAGMKQVWDYFKRRSMENGRQMGVSRNVKLRIPEIVVILLIFGVHSWGFWYYNGITILRDEFGYWEHAASMAGYDWSGAMISAPWYSFGYSLLLLPLFYLCNGMSQMYHVAIFMNGLMMVAVYGIVKSLISKLSSMENRNVPESEGMTGGKCRMNRRGADILVAMIVCLYSAYIAQSKVAWAETAIYLAFWLTVWCFANLLEKKSIRWGIATSVMAGICYTCHNRMIVVMIALFMITILMCIGRQISWKNVLGLLIPMIVIYIWNEQVRDILQGRMQVNAELQYNLNDIEGRWWRVKVFFTKEGFTHWLRTAIGELLYVYLSTFAVGIIGILSAGHSLLKMIKGRRREFYFFCFILLVFIGEWALSTLVNMPVGEDIAEKPLTYLYYGRYVDGVVGIFLLLGLLHLRDYKGRYLAWEATVVNTVMLVAAIATYQYSQDFLHEEMNFVCVPGIWYMERHEWLNVIVVTLGVAIVVQLVLMGCAKDRESMECRLVAGGMAAVLFLLVGVSYSKVCIGYVRSYKQDVFAWAEQNIGEQEVYCISDENTRFFAQAQLTGHRIKLIERADVPYLEEDCFLITMREEYAEQMNVCINSEMYYVYLTDGEVYEGLLEKGLVVKELEQ